MFVRTRTAGHGAFH